MSTKCLGKDTFCVGLLGYSGAGKDTAAEVLTALIGFTRIAFGDGVKNVLEVLNPFVPVKLRKAVYDPVTRAPIVGKSKESVSMMPLVDLIGAAGGGWIPDIKNIPEVRRLMQSLGSDVGRQLIDPDIWVNMAIKKAAGNSRLVFTDIRYPNEIELLLGQRIKCLLVRIVKSSGKGSEPINDHASEVALSSYYNRCITITNDGSIDDLHTEIIAAIIGHLQEIKNTHHLKHVLKCMSIER